MSDTLLSSLSSTLSLANRAHLAKLLTESEPSISKGLESATAAVFAGLRNQTGHPEKMRQLIDLASKSPSDIGAALNTGQLTNPNPPFLASGKKLLASLLGPGENAAVNTLSRDSGLRVTSAATVLAVAAQSVLSFIGARVRDEGMTATTLAAFLQNGYSPATTEPQADLLNAEKVTTRRLDIDPVIAQSVKKEGRPIWFWLLPLLLILAGLALWFFIRPQQAPVSQAPTPADTSVPAPPATPDLGAFVARTLPNGATLNIPERGVEGRLLAFIQDPAQKPDKTSWFDFDRLLFNTGSANLQPQSLEQLHNIAAILKAYPATHLTIGGYTDNTGDPAKNLALSQERAHNVTAELVKLGVASDRLVAKGYGDQHPVGDNSTEAGRAQNRRISMLVTQK